MNIIIDGCASFSSFSDKECDFRQSGCCISGQEIVHCVKRLCQKMHAFEIELQRSHSSSCQDFS